MPPKRWHRIDAGGKGGGGERGDGYAFTRGALLVVESRLEGSRPRLPLAWSWFLGGEACVAVLGGVMTLREDSW